MSHSIRFVGRFLLVLAIAGALLYIATPMPSSNSPYASSMNIVPVAQAAAPCKICDNSTGKYRCINDRTGGACKVTSSGLGCRSSIGC